MTRLPLLADDPDTLVRWFCDEATRLEAIANSGNDPVLLSEMEPETAEILTHLLVNMRDEIRRLDAAPPASSPETNGDVR